MLVTRLPRGSTFCLARTLVLHCQTNCSSPGLCRSEINSFNKVLTKIIWKYNDINCIFVEQLKTMEKTIELYKSASHVPEKSYDVLIVQQKSEKYKRRLLKMTYECYNNGERFSGELFVNGKWEHCFSKLDLGEEKSPVSYHSSTTDRLKRAKDLQKKGIKFYEILNQAN